MSEKFLNRDISWLSFNRRVSDEMFKAIPLGEKVLFQGISFSNLTEFLQVRYPSAYELEPDEMVSEIRKQITDHYDLITERWVKFNKKQKLIRSIRSLSKKELHWANQYFKDYVYPALQTISFDRAKRLNLHAGFYVLVAYDVDDDTQYGYIEIPRAISRFIAVPDKPYCIAIEDLIRENIGKLFLNTKKQVVTPFSISRSAEVYVNMDLYSDPFTMIQRTLKERDKAWITCLEIGGKDAVSILKEILPITDKTLVLSGKYIHMQDLKSLPSKIFGIEDRCRKYEPVVTVPPMRSIFDYIKEKDRLLFHPYESYQGSFVRFLQDASNDPDVISIKIALYRVSDNSQIISALLNAADKGKLVTVLVELKARFDEHHNIEISKILQEGGVRVIFTKPDMKTHAKVCLVTRKENKGIRVYSHVGTGNYSESNSKQYTDYSYLSADRELGKDLTQFFNLLTSNQDAFKSRRIIYAPYNMREELEHEIDKQVKLAKKGKNARIIAKCNSLTDEKMASWLISAAEAGVKITLLVRGSCIIQPRKNIKIYSLVGFYLEHSRLYVFGKGKDASVYIGSADLMSRNLSARNELLLKVEQKDLKDRLKNHLQMYLKDTVNLREILPEYNYRSIKPGKKKDRYNAQMEFRKEAKRLV